MHISCTQALALAMGLVIATPVDAAAIGRPGEHNSAGSTDFNVHSSHGIHSVNKRSPIINPLFPVKIPLTLLAAKVSDLSGASNIIGNIPGIGKLYKLFWFKKGFFSAGK